jgi:hypothetical protein
MEAESFNSRSRVALLLSNSNHFHPGNTNTAPSTSYYPVIHLDLCSTRTESLSTMRIQ